MKNIVTLLLFFILVFGIGEQKTLAQSSSKLVEFCSTSAGDDATYLKDFPAELEAVGSDGIAKEQRYTMLLSKNTEYRFTVCNMEGSEGKAILSLFDMNKPYLSTYNAATGQHFKSVNFQCQKTGAYHLIITFQDGKKGSATAILSFIKTL
jgi:hypothetical protein